ncbi:MAG TPA: methyltransferase [Thermomicrobiaceae bacterium]|nr:methyltransferase [Thermomicrobiaceae bacterium]
MSDPGPSPQARLIEMMQRFRLPQAVIAATRLGIADHLASGSCTAEDLAARTGTDPRAVAALLLALAGADVLTVDDSGRYALAPLGELLRAERVPSRRAQVLNFAQQYQLWGEGLEYSLRTGRPAFEHVFGRAYFEYLERNPDQAAHWNASMEETAHELFAPLPGIYDFGRFSTVVDVGGGRGTLLATVLRSVPHLRGVLFDRPEVVADAPQVLEAAGVDGRVMVTPGDMFQTVPTGGDAYVLARVLWDWDDRAAGIILRRCRQAMPDRARLLVVEHVLPDGPRHPATGLSDLNLLMTFGGRMRTESELGALLAATGFAVREIRPLFGRHRLVEATPVAAG